MDNIEFNVDILLAKLKDYSNQPYHAILYILNEVSIFRPDLMTKCAELDSMYRRAFDKR